MVIYTQFIHTHTHTHTPSPPPSSPPTSSNPLRFSRISSECDPIHKTYIFPTADPPTLRGHCANRISVRFGYGFQTLPRQRIANRAGRRRPALGPMMDRVLCAGPNWLPDNVQLPSTAAYVSGDGRRTPVKLARSLPSRSETPCRRWRVGERGAKWIV